MDTFSLPIEIFTALFMCLVIAILILAMLATTPFRCKSKENFVTEFFTVLPLKTDLKAVVRAKDSLVVKSELRLDFVDPCELSAVSIQKGNTGEILSGQIIPIDLAGNVGTAINFTCKYGCSPSSPGIQGLSDVYYFQLQEPIVCIGFIIRPVKWVNNPDGRFLAHGTILGISSTRQKIVSLISSVTGSVSGKIILGFANGKLVTPGESSDALDCIPRFVAYSFGQIIKTDGMKKNIIDGKKFFTFVPINSYDMGKYSLYHIAVNENGVRSVNVYNLYSAGHDIYMNALSGKMQDDQFNTFWFAERYEPSPKQNGLLCSIYTAVTNGPNGWFRGSYIDSFIHRGPLFMQGRRRVLCLETGRIFLEYSGYVDCGPPGYNIFTLDSTGNSRLYVNGELVIDGWTNLDLNTDKLKTVDSKPIYSNGPVSIKLEYSRPATPDNINSGIYEKSLGFRLKLNGNVIDYFQTATDSMIEFGEPDVIVGLKRSGYIKANCLGWHLSDTMVLSGDWVNVMPYSGDVKKDLLLFRKNITKDIFGYLVATEYYGQSPYFRSGYQWLSPQSSTLVTGLAIGHPLTNRLLTEFIANHYSSKIQSAIDAWYKLSSA